MQCTLSMICMLSVTSCTHDCVLIVSKLTCVCQCLWTVIPALGTENLLWPMTSSWVSSWAPNLIPHWSMKHPYCGHVVMLVACNSSPPCFATDVYCPRLLCSWLPSMLNVQLHVVHRVYFRHFLEWEQMTSYTVPLTDVRVGALYMYQAFLLWGFMIPWFRARCVGSTPCINLGCGWVDRH